VIKMLYAIKTTSHNNIWPEDFNVELRDMWQKSIDGGWEKISTFIIQIQDLKKLNELIEKSDKDLILSRHSYLYANKNGPMLSKITIYDDYIE